MEIDAIETRNARIILKFIYLIVSVERFVSIFFLRYGKNSTAYFLKSTLPERIFSTIHLSTLICKMTTAVFSRAGLRYVIDKCIFYDLIFNLRWITIYFLFVLINKTINK